MTGQSNNLCSKLDEFLDRSLPSREHAEFVDHLASCTTCREAVDEQQWIDELLRSEVAAALESAPAPAAIPLRHPVRRGALVAVAAAIAAAAALPLLFLARGKGFGEGQPAVASKPLPTPSATGAAGSSPSKQAAGADPSPSPSLRGRGISEATFVSSGSTIAVPVASLDPEVTIVKLYPTVTASRRWARESALRERAVLPTGG